MSPPAPLPLHLPQRRGSAEHLCPSLCKRWSPTKSCSLFQALPTAHGSAGGRAGPREVLGRAVFVQGRGEGRWPSRALPTLALTVSGMATASSLAWSLLKDFLPSLPWPATIAPAPHQPGAGLGSAATLGGLCRAVDCVLGAWWTLEAGSCSVIAMGGWARVRVYGLGITGAGATREQGLPRCLLLCEATQAPFCHPVVSLPPYCATPHE